MTAKEEVNLGLSRPFLGRSLWPAPGHSHEVGGLQGTPMSSLCDIGEDRAHSPERP
jgi:hypothetical protein